MGGSRSRALSTTVLQPVEENGRGAPIILPGGRKKDFEPLDLFVRAGTVAIRAKEWGVSTEAARTKMYGEDSPPRKHATSSCAPRRRQR